MKRSILVLLVGVFAVVIVVGVVLLFATSPWRFSPAAIPSSQAPAKINLLTIFLTGLFTGGLTCLAVQGGLLATTIAQREEQQLKERMKEHNTALPIFIFLLAKLLAYTILGFFLGWLGSLFTLSLTATVVMRVAIAIFMLGTALNLLNAHPIFRYFMIQPPRFLTRLIRNQSKQKDFFAPALLGAFTVFIPCGTTQAMMALAIGSGNPLLGAATLFAFVIGTSPLFFILGYFATRLGESLHRRFMKLAACALIILALYNLDGALALSGSPFTLRTLFSSAQAIGQQNSTSEATIFLTERGYSPSSLTIKAGTAVTLRLVNKGGRGCIQAFVIPRLGIQKIIPVDTTDTIQFTAPSQSGQLSFMCGMGMFRGVMNVI